jgi:hypothetical protein
MLLAALLWLTSPESLVALGVVAVLAALSEFPLHFKE